jgi:hypothetical protein
VMATLSLDRIEQRLNSIVRGKSRFIDNTDDLRVECPHFIRIYYYTGGFNMENENHRVIYYNSEYTKCVILTFASGARIHVKDCTSDPAAIRAFIERFQARDSARGADVLYKDNTYTFQDISIEF